MSGPLAWWANRKSRIGVSPAALPPPHEPGKPWWTVPPTAVPQPEHIEYVVQFMRQLQAGGKLPNGRNWPRNAMLGKCSDWLRAARQLLHEQVESQHGDLHTTDGLLVRAARTYGMLLAKCCHAGVLGTDELEEFGEVKQALEARAARVRRERAVESSKRAEPVAAPRLRLRVGERMRGGRERR